MDTISIMKLNYINDTCLVPKLRTNLILESSGIRNKRIEISIRINNYIHNFLIHISITDIFSIYYTILYINQIPVI